MIISTHRTSVPTHDLSPLRDISLQLGEFCSFYPGIEDWFWEKVVPGIGDGSRAIFTRGEGRIDALLIAKRDIVERKICTLWVDPLKRGNRIASSLIDEAIDWLGTPSPVISAPEERMAQLDPVLKKRGFVCTQVLLGHYRPGKAEFVYNGSLLAGRASDRLN